MASASDRRIPTQDPVHAMADVNIDNTAETGVAATVTTTSISPSIPSSAQNPPSAISNNHPGFKYKYPQANPTPPGVDDSEWNKLFTAADSRFYNRANKNAAVSRKNRESGETRTLALQMLREKREKATSKGNNTIPGNSTTCAAPLSTMAPKPKPSTSKNARNSKEAPPVASSREATPATMDMTERIKTEGRSRKTASSAPSELDSRAPSPVANSGSSVAPQKPGPKKGTATSTKQQQPTKSLSKNNTNGTAPSSRQASHTPGPKGSVSGDESNDGAVYCVCRGPDDHRMMILCEGGCEDWYHCSCVGLDEGIVKELLDKFVCPKCTIPGQVFTTFKRICRYQNVGLHLNQPACRRAARVAGDPISKYCSEEHRIAFWAFVSTLYRKSDTLSRGGALTRMEANGLFVGVEDFEAFRRLGDKPHLSPQEGDDPDRPRGLDHLLPEEARKIEDIKNKLIELEGKLRVCEKQITMFQMVVRRIEKAAAHLNESKLLCGYDNRMAFNEQQFEQWCQTTEAKTAFATSVLGPRTDETMGIGDQSDLETPAVPDVLKSMCLSLEKSKCKHNRQGNWREIHARNLIFQSTFLHAEIKKLMAEEAEIADDAETRAASKKFDGVNKTVSLF